MARRGADPYQLDTPTFPSQMEVMSNSHRPQDRLSDPVFAARAWARYRWIMRWVIAAAVLSVFGALFFLWVDGAPFTATLIIATSAGVALTVLLAGALMGLIFLSAGSGHDEVVARFEEEQDGDDAGDPSSRWDRRR